MVVFWPVQAHDYTRQNNIEEYGGPGIRTQVLWPFPSGSLPTKPHTLVVYQTTINQYIKKQTK